MEHVRKITEKIYQIKLPIPFPLQTVNVYFVDESPRTLVNTGIKTEASFEALKNGMEAAGFSLGSIERILITHGHIDHYGLAKRIASLSGGSIYIHSEEYGKTRSVTHSLGILKMLLLRNGVPKALVDEAARYIESAHRMADPLEEAFFLEDGDAIPFRSTSWQAVHCPGHSSGLLCFYGKEEKLLVTGDHLLKEITPNPTLNLSKGGPPFQYTSLKQYIASLKKIERLDFNLALPAHGELIDDPKDIIGKIQKHHRERMDLILSILSRGRTTSYEIAMELFPGVPPFEVFLGISEVLGHIGILKEEGKVKVCEERNKDYYSLR